MGCSTQTLAHNLIPRIVLITNFQVNGKKMSVVSKHGRLFANSSSGNARAIALVIGLVVMSKITPFAREYATPNPSGRPDFHVSDFEVFTPEGLKVLLEFCGDDRAAYIILAIR